MSCCCPIGRPPAKPPPTSARVVSVKKEERGSASLMKEKYQDTGAPPPLADGNISWPKSIPSDARDFIEAQINVDPLKRPGSMKDGALDVKTHKWLAQVDWKKAEARKLEAPWKPKIKSATDASNFDEFDDDAKENFPREDFAKDLFKEFADVWV